ncbi:LuxR C-terminal-related transcriptional regulator [Deinococcus pimensis]|uniref:LuxR C-terminal-related transcriptional regulator n=1 Tax=Deinococcus pimensis TaxID=309888 RepID=UPI0004B28DC9|nr:LuxR C-terminal-related transcriptional regulator [Deinococcus pimensis]
MNNLEPLIDIKLQAPQVGTSLLHRPRLTSRLDQGLQRPFTLVSAPAGYGKSTLVAAWVQDRTAVQASPDLDVAWVALEAEDDNPTRFWRYVLTSIERQRPGMARSALEALMQPAQPLLRDVLTHLLNRMVEMTRPLVLILDDYHDVNDQVIHQSVAYLIDHLPEQLHVTMLTRTEPPLPLARLRANGGMLELKADDLRCTFEESQAFLGHVAGRPVAPDVAHELHLRCEGWLVGLQLLAISLQGRRDARALLHELRGNHRLVTDYLMDEVLRQLPGDVRHFLLQSAVLERLSGPLCDAVLERHDSSEMLAMLERHQLFVISLDAPHSWYRYHTLFRDALLDRFARHPFDARLALHERASQWFAAHDDLLTAIEHALQANTPQRAVTWMASISMERLLNPELAPKIIAWFERIPADLVYQHPSLWWVYVARLLLNNRDHAVESWLAELERRLTLPEGDPLTLPVPHLERPAIRAFIAAQRAIIAGFFVNAPRAVALADDASRHDAHADSPTRPLIMAARSVAALIEGELPLARDLATSAARHAHDQGMYDTALLFHSTAALYHYFCGQVRDVWPAYLAAINTPHADLAAASGGYAPILQALLFREQNDLDAAQREIEHGLQLAWQQGQRRLLDMALGVLCLVCWSRGDVEQANNALDAHRHLPHASEDTFTRAVWITPIQVRVWITTDQWSTALTWAQHLDRHPRPSSIFLRERQDLARARVHLAVHQPHLVVDTLAALLPDAERQGRGEHQLEAHLLLSVAHHELGDTVNAHRHLTSALHLGRRWGYLRHFIDEGPIMRELLRGHAGGAAAPHHAFVHDLLNAFDGHTATGHPTASSTVPAETTGAALSVRERQVLQLLARGLSNDDIARHLGVSLPTVKSHVRNLMKKLQTRNRTQSVERARTLGYL